MKNFMFFCLHHLPHCLGPQSYFGQKLPPSLLAGQWMVEGVNLEGRSAMEFVKLKEAGPWQSRALAQWRGTCISVQLRPSSEGKGPFYPQLSS